MPPKSEYDIQSLSASVGPMPGEVTTSLSPDVLNMLLLQPGLVAAVKDWVQMDGYVEYTIVVERWARISDAMPSTEEGAPKGTLVGESQHRYSSFRALHDAIGEQLGLRFTAPKTLPMFKDASFVKEERKTKLAAYLNAALLVVQAREIEVPEALRAFLKMKKPSTPILSVKRTPLGPLVTNGANMLEKQRVWLKAKIDGLGEAGATGASAEKATWLSGVFASRKEEAAANQATEEKKATALVATKEEEEKPTGMAVAPDGTIVPMHTGGPWRGPACLVTRSASGSGSFSRFLCISHRKSAKA